MDHSFHGGATENIEDALLSAEHMSYDGNATETTKNDQTSQVSSAGFGITQPTKIKSRRKSTFVNQPKATVFSSMMNLCNTVIGAGILALPRTMVFTGWLFGFVLLLFFAVASQITLNLAMMSALALKKTKNVRVSYLTLCQNTVPKLSILVDLAVGLTCVGITCAYLIVIGDYMPDVASQIINRSPQNESSTVEAILESRQFWIVIFLILFIIPTVRLKKLDALRFTSTAAIICFSYVTVIVVLYAFIEALDLCDPNDPQRYETFCRDTDVEILPIEGAEDALKFFKAAPSIMFAFTCHQNAFTVVNEIRHPSKANLNIVNVGTISICCVIYMVVAFSGYLSFGISTPANLLTAYPRKIPILVVRICLSMAIAFSYPVLAYPGRNSLSSLIFGVSEAKQLHWIKYHGITWAIVLITFTLSMLTDDLGIVLDVVGATGTTVIAFVLPGLFFYNIPNKWMNAAQWKRYMALFMILFGCVLIPFGLAMVFVDP